MKKPITVLSTVSIIISCAALLFAVAGLTLFCKQLYSIFLPSYADEYTTVIPWGEMAHIIAYSVISVLLFFCVKQSNKSLSVEIVSIVLLSFVIPVVLFFVGLFYNYWINNSLGAKASMSLSVAKTILQLPIGLANISAALSLVISGMSIADKVKNKQQPTYNV